MSFCSKERNRCQRSSPSAWWLFLHPPLHYCLSCNFLSSGDHLIMQICNCAGHLACVECDAYRHGDGCWGFRPGQFLLPLAYLTRPSSLSSLCLPWCAMMCTEFINSSGFSHRFYIIRTFRLALNQCWHGTRGTTAWLSDITTFIYLPLKTWLYFLLQYGAFDSRHIPVSHPINNIIIERIWRVAWRIHNMI